LTLSADTHLVRRCATSGRSRRVQTRRTNRGSSWYRRTGPRRTCRLAACGRARSPKPCEPWRRSITW